ncbi:MAG TPA: hypothetical protein VM491_12670 [Burkholderiaceae bacterium]|jgi:hypothetical protein|nr:hypothetical protein [Burkholderiaceae bacterium]
MIKRASVLVGFAVAAASMPLHAADVGVSVQVGQPGFYGRIDIGSMPPPQVVYPQPVVVVPGPVAVVRQPIYLHVPPGHARNWDKHCAKYHACAQPVYFVDEHWYRTVYVSQPAPDKRGKRKHGRD